MKSPRQSLKRILTRQYVLLACVPLLLVIVLWSAVAIPQTLRDVLSVPGTWPGLQHPVVLDHFGDSINRFHLSEVRKGHFVMLSS